MKKINYLALAAAGLLMASCSQDDLQGPATGEGNVHITLSLPAELATRAEFGTGTQAVNLQYAVYEVTGSEGSYTYTNVLDEGKTGFFNGTSLSNTLNLDLLSGKHYLLAFFASANDLSENATGNVYDVNWASNTISVAYGNMNSEGNNGDKYDCFFNTFDIPEVNGPVNGTVYLYRPIAQINWGSNDLTKPLVEANYGTAGADIETTLTLKNAPTVLNFLSGEVSGQQDVPVNIGPFDIPSNYSFPVSGYNYVGMQYVLAANSSSIYNMDLTIASSKESHVVTVTDVPLQANFRTNIYGSLLTDAANLTIEIKPGFTEPAHNNPLAWDGTSTAQPTKNTDGAYVITTPAEWIWLTKNKSDNDYVGGIASDVVLNANLDFGGNEVQGVRMNGTFEGNGYTISNLTVIPRSSYATGFFAGDIAMSDAPLQVQNLTFKNVNITNHATGYGWVGTVIADVQSKPVILDNVHVVNANLNGILSIGGLVGFVASNQSLTITNCSVESSLLENIPVAGESGFVGGLVGRPVGPVTASGCSVSNTTINAYYAANRGESSIQEAIGTQASPAGVTVNNVTVTRTEVTTGVSVNGTTYESLAAAVEANPTGATIQLGLGNYSTPSTFGSGDFVIKGLGEEYTIVEANITTWGDSGTVTASDLTFQSFANPTNHTHMAFTGATNQTFTNVAFNGEFHVTTGNATFNDCTFTYDQASGTNYQLWCQTPGTITINNCTMNCGPARALLIYGNTKGQNPGNINIDGLTVTAQTADSKAVCEIHSENYAEGSKATLTISNVTYPANLFQKGLWQELYYVGQPNYTVVEN